jgi:hypothetical protein
MREKNGLVCVRHSDEWRVYPRCLRRWWAREPLYGIENNVEDSIRREQIIGLMVYLAGT